MNHTLLRTLTGVISGVLFFGTYLISPYFFVTLLGIILVWILLYEWPLVTGRSLRSRRFWIDSILYPIVPFIILMYAILAYAHYSVYIALYPFITAWLCDTGGYFVGTYLGTHHIAPQISPKKTWEGLFGGIVLVFGYHLFLKIVFSDLTDTVISLFGWSIVIATMALLGDLFVSYLKRSRDIKDTGWILPGHGGLLDRFDSVLFIALTTGSILCIRSVIHLFK